MQTVHVENLPVGTTVPDLESLFRPFGWVTGVDLRPRPGGAAGAVDLVWGADLAVRCLNGTDYRGHGLAVRAARPAALDPASAAGVM